MAYSAQRRGFLARHGFLLAAGLFFLVTLIVWIVLSAQHSSAQAQRDGELLSLDQSYITAQQRFQLAQTELVDEATGADSSRAAEDAAMLESLLSTALNWSDHDSYVASREAVMEDYGVDEDSGFMTSFLPAAPVNTDEQGNEYYYIDAMGLNSSLENVSAEVVAVSGSDYSYIVTVEVSASTELGGGSLPSAASDQSVIFATVQGSGEIAELQGYATGTAPRSSN